MDLGFAIRLVDRWSVASTVVLVAMLSVMSTLLRVGPPIILGSNGCPMTSIASTTYRTAGGDRNTVVVLQVGGALVGVNRDQSGCKVPQYR